MTAAIRSETATLAAAPSGVGGAPLRARRSPRLVVLGVLLACLGGVGAGAVWTRSSHVDEVVVVVASVERGEVVQASDLGTTSVSVGLGVSTVPASDIGSVVGQRALTDLPAGSLLGANSTGTPPATSGSVVGLRLPAGRLPQLPMPAGTKVLLIPVAAQQGAAPATPSQPIPAVIVTAAQPLQDGVAWVVDVEVSGDQATLVAQLSASEQVVLVKAPGA